MVARSILASVFVSTGLFLGSASALTCEVAGGTSDDSSAIKAAFTQCNNGGTVSVPVYGV